MTESAGDPAYHIYKSEIFKVGQWFTTLSFRALLSDSAPLKRLTPTEREKLLLCTRMFQEHCSSKKGRYPTPNMTPRQGDNIICGKSWISYCRTLRSPVVEQSLVSNEHCQNVLIAKFLDTVLKNTIGLRTRWPLLKN